MSTKTTTPTALAGPRNDEDEGMAPECAKCGAVVAVRPGAEWNQGESICDPCAQDELTVAELDLADAIAACKLARAALDECRNGPSQVKREAYVALAKVLSP